MASCVELDPTLSTIFLRDIHSLVARSRTVSGSRLMRFTFALIQVRTIVGEGVLPSGLGPGRISPARARHSPGRWIILSIAAGF